MSLTGIGAGIVTVILSAAAQDVVTLNDLTVPQPRLPAACALAPAADPVGLGITANPWIGSDLPVIGSIRERLGRPTGLPDGPPLTRTQLARFRLRMAEGIEEGYVAVYQQPSPQLILVYGLRFASVPDRDQLLRETRTPPNPRVMSVGVGSMLAVVHGDGECARAIATYLASLATRPPR